VRRRVREVYGRREVLLNLVRKELKVKYTASFLGAMWSLLNPVVFLAVFTFVVRITNNSFAHFPVYLLSGLLAWNLFSVSLAGGARSVIDNANLVKKVAFPREVLPLSAIGVALVDFVLQTAVLLLFILVSGYGIHLPELAIYPLAFATLLVFTLALTFWVAALNVRYRDIQHLLNIALLVWFWATPIVYAEYQVQRLAQGGTGTLLGIDRFALYLLNPLTDIVAGFHRALYGVVIPEGSATPVLFEQSLAWVAGILAVTLVVALVVLRFTWASFFMRSGDFAEEL
jgi:ABC-2 type transport system permease protein